MRILIAGAGRLATELMNSKELRKLHSVVPWSSDVHEADKSIVVHAGSGRELSAISAYCDKTKSALVELSTGSSIESMSVNFPVVLCPNTNILMLKFMALFEISGHQFREYEIELSESHQSGKTSVPGTAVSIASALGIQSNDIRSVRDTSVQRNEFHIPETELSRHAFHRIEVRDGSCSLRFESTVLGEAPYAAGVAKIVDAMTHRVLEPRTYSVTEFIKSGWI
jgi:4-hydroxy-tetrahydrodipicolinate reductase